MRCPSWPAWLTSLVVHAWCLLALALWVISQDVQTEEVQLTVLAPHTTADLEVVSLDLQPIRAVTAPMTVIAPDAGELETTQIVLPPRDSGSRLGPNPDAEPLEASDLLVPVGSRRGGFAGRHPEARDELVARRGGSQESEQAVARGLRWLMAHQLDDGSWRFNIHRAAQCRGQCSHPGTVGSTTAATALALLSFLGAGSTHVGGEYEEVVGRGLYYLNSRMILGAHGGDLQEGTMYAQGLATIALCEAYAMTKDESLREQAQAAINFISYAQHPGGGWRYLPGQPGDTTSVGWQLMALKSGQMAGLEVPSPTISLAVRFLDSVASDGGAAYGYQRPGRDPAMTAIGLVCRMYLGWPREHEALGRGVYYLSDLGPSRTNMYFNYYATQVLHHYEGGAWNDWNPAMREHLIQTQATEGHESGSWQFDDAKTSAAGRLYNTAMAIMILEVYYRHLPLYTRQALDGDVFSQSEKRN